MLTTCDPYMRVRHCTAAGVCTGWSQGPRASDTVHPTWNSVYVYYLAEEGDYLAFHVRQPAQASARMIEWGG